MGSTVPSKTDWFTFGLVAAAYFTVSVGESILAPAFPTIVRSLPVGFEFAGIAFGVLTGSIAVGTFGGGYLFARTGPRVSICMSLLIAAAGSVVTATAAGRLSFLLGQALIGLGAGTFFPAGMSTAGFLAGGRRGLAMGIFGVAFSGGLTAGAGLATFGAATDWRRPFVVATVLCVTACIATGTARLPVRPGGQAGGRHRPLRDALGVPVLVGGIGTVSQYGTVAFLPAFAVVTWGLAPAHAALMIGVARVLSVGAKLGAGAAADRWGSRAAVTGLAVILSLSGLAWAAVPIAPLPLLLAPAVVFVASVSALFPVANLLALEDFGDRGPLLGTYRAAQIGIGAVGAFLIGLVSNTVGLRPTLIASTTMPLLLLSTWRHTRVLLPGRRKRGSSSR